MLHGLRVFVRMELIARHNLKKIEKYFLMLKKNPVKAIYTCTEKILLHMPNVEEKITLHWNYNKVYSHRTHSQKIQFY